MLKTKIFFGGFCRDRADDQFNKWSEENPDVRVVNVSYQHVRGGEHSILVVYTEAEDAD